MLKNWSVRLRALGVAHHKPDRVRLALFVDHRDQHDALMRQDRQPVNAPQCQRLEERLQTHLELLCPRHRKLEADASHVQVDVALGGGRARLEALGTRIATLRCLCDAGLAEVGVQALLEQPVEVVPQIAAGQEVLGTTESMSAEKRADRKPVHKSHHARVLSVAMTAFLSAESGTKTARS